MDRLQDAVDARRRFGVPAEEAAGLIRHRYRAGAEIDFYRAQPGDCLHAGKLSLALWPCRRARLTMPAISSPRRPVAGTRFHAAVLPDGG